MQQLALIEHEVEKTVIYQRAIDGYVNATAMCKAVGKQFNDYSRIGPTKAFFGRAFYRNGHTRFAIDSNI